MGETDIKTQSSRIKIVSPPAGEAPEWVREAWVGVTIPLLQQSAPETPTIGIHGGEASSENKGGYVVDFREALDALHVHAPVAAVWWRDNAPMAAAIGKLQFGAQFCKLIVD